VRHEDDAEGQVNNMINTHEMWKLRDEVLTGKAPAAYLVAVFDVVLEELEVRQPKPKMVHPNQLDMFPEVK